MTLGPGRAPFPRPREPGKTTWMTAFAGMTDETQTLIWVARYPGASRLVATPEVPMRCCSRIQHLPNALIKFTGSIGMIDYSGVK